MNDTKTKKLLIIGASGHGKVVADTALRNGYEKIAFLDDNESVTECMGFPVIGKTSTIYSYPDADAFVAIGNPGIRERIQKELTEKGVKIVTLIHPSAVIGTKVQIGAGTVIMAGAVINPDTCIGNGCIINTGATVDHDNKIADFAHVSVGSHLAGTVTIGKKTWIGVGAAVSNNITICDDCMIGAGAVIIKDIAEPGTYVGVPARKVK